MNILHHTRTSTRKQRKHDKVQKFETQRYVINASRPYAGLSGQGGQLGRSGKDFQRKRDRDRDRQNVFKCGNRVADCLRRVNVTCEGNAWSDYVTSTREATELDESELRTQHSSKPGTVVRAKT